MPKNELYLEPLNEAHLAQLLQWRNEVNNRKWMQNQVVIGMTEQMEWFRNIDSSNFQLFIIFHQEKPIGEIHLKNIDLKKGSAESGIMMDPEVKGTGMAFSASLLLLTYAFEELQLNDLFAKVNRENNEAKKYNQFLGFELVEERADLFDYYRLKKEDYPQIKEKLNLLTRF
jgi:UDP-4-amino-4,6-dideoxy-N-acetyl-beta-L-altrosamine N-acetyltransferase